MPQPTDVVIAGAGYMVTPGSYRRSSDGLPEGRAGRVVLRDFFGGQHRAIQLERDRGWDGLGVHSCFGGQGVEPWPQQTTFADTGISPEAAIATGKRCPHTVLGSAGTTRTYVWIDGKLYRCPAGGAVIWDGLDLVADLSGFPGEDITTHIVPGAGARIAVALGPNTELRLIDPTEPPVSAVSVFKAGERASTVASYGGALIYGGGRLDEGHLLHFSDGIDVDTRTLDAPITAMSTHQGNIAIATRFGLWLLGGRWVPAVPAVIDPDTSEEVSPRRPGYWQGEPQPFFSSGFWTNDGDYAFLVSYGGKLYTWLAHQVMEYDPGQGTQRQGWRSTGLEGARAYGGCVAGGYMIVVIETWRGQTETWAFDGSGWWVVARRQTTAGQTPCWPLPTGGAADTDLLVFRDDSASYDLYRLIPRSPSKGAYSTSGQYVTSLLDGGERDKPKTWRRAGATFATPEPRGNPGSNDPVTVQLQVSADAGASWTTVTFQTPDDGANRTLDLIGEVPDTVPDATFLQLRVAWSGVLDWAPVLTGLWAEYELLDTPTRRRRWSLDVAARDGTVERNGARHPRDGRSLAADLWDTWSAGTTVPFQDLDFDITDTTYRVRITGIEERVTRPTDHAQSGDSVVRLTLVEV